MLWCLIYNCIDFFQPDKLHVLHSQKGLHEIRLFFKRKFRPFRVVLEEFCMKLTQGHTCDAFTASSELLLS